MPMTHDAPAQASGVEDRASIFFEVATLNQPVDGQFYAVVRINTDNRIDDGCEGVVASLHQTYPEAAAAVERSRACLATPADGGRDG
ncbi:hypothetical protein [Bosea sp. (in: a-proteobacteria)]|uniref:hypothetical protein n=1 Tax=Bosea sp. (in: a-proteobacteria) TaxID=1871050 RepID=UPI003B3AA0AE